MIILITMIISIVNNTVIISSSSRRRRLRSDTLLRRAQRAGCHLLASEGQVSLHGSDRRPLGLEEQRRQAHRGQGRRPRGPRRSPVRQGADDQAAAASRHRDGAEALSAGLPNNDNDNDNDDNNNHNDNNNNRNK